MFCIFTMRLNFNVSYYHVYYDFFWQNRWTNEFKTVYRDKNEFGEQLKQFGSYNKQAELLIIFFISHFLQLKKTLRDPIPEESLPKRGLLLNAKPSPTMPRDRQRSKPTTSLLPHRISSDSENSDEQASEKLMKSNKHKANFSLGESDDDDDRGNNRT